ncbi:MAG: electron transfer flavoprotein subunit alpha/FixB family protein [Chloroflexi bacterium]|nr:electron transfer flavoprotein subunit alpha/FixB family protein [Chloroflexota bacterium]
MLSEQSYDIKRTVERSKEVWVYAEPRGDHVARVSLELLGKARQLGAVLSSIIIGSGVERLAAELADYGAEKIYLVDDSRLEYYQSQAYASIVSDLVKEHMPEIFLLGATDSGEDLAPRVAASVGTGLTAHCVDLRIRERDGVPLLHQTVPGWGDSKRIDIICPRKRPQMATVKPGVFDLPAVKKERKSEVIRTYPQLSERHFRARTVEVKEEKACELPLDEAEVVVAAGWGACSLGGVELVRELAEVACGAVAGTRPMVDKGLIAQDRMIGQSGKVVGPRLFISLGASGAMHFTTGFERARFVLAVDQNAQAPIFEAADVGIVGDLSEMLPCLIKEFRKLKTQ